MKRWEGGQSHRHGMSSGQSEKSGTDDVPSATDSRAGVYVVDLQLYFVQILIRIVIKSGLKMEVDRDDGKVVSPF